jgi:soluble lytic murein transglycosylase-like protein
VIAAFRYGVKYDIDPKLLLAIAFVESSFNPLARSKSSIGLMGINYKVWRKELSLDLYKLWAIDYNMDKGAFILKHYITKSGDVWKGVFMYTNGYKGRNMKYVPKVQTIYNKLKGE